MKTQFAYLCVAPCSEVELNFKLAESKRAAEVESYDQVTNPLDDSHVWNSKSAKADVRGDKCLSSLEEALLWLESNTTVDGPLIVVKCKGINTEWRWVCGGSKNL